MSAEAMQFHEINLAPALTPHLGPLFSLKQSHKKIWTYGAL